MLTQIAGSDDPPYKLIKIGDGITDNTLDMGPSGVPAAPLGLIVVSLAWGVLPRVWRWLGGFGDRLWAFFLGWGWGVRACPVSGVL